MTKYEPLHDWLARQPGPEVRVTFAEVAKLIEAKLPRSARTYDAWWLDRSTGTTHVQARAWLAAGWCVAAVDREGEKVTFGRLDRTSSSGVSL